MTPQELKNSILQLAIQGKLVEQRLEEGTAEELYLQVQAEKRHLFKEGKLKKEKPLPEITEDEKPFDIPENWLWVRLGSVISLLSGQDMQPSEYNENRKGIPYITGASNIDDSRIYVNRWTDSPKAIARKGDLLLTCKGTVGKTAILNEDEVHIARQIMAITPFVVIAEYIKFFIESQIAYLKSQAKSMIPGIERSNVLFLLIPLPPLPEQKRIVAKIEELLPYIDRYEQAWSKLEDFNKRFPGDMQKSILQMAIQGKLVEQRPEDGTGEELYRQIQAEKQKLIKAGKIKKEKPLPEIAEDEKPFDIPESWKWVRLGRVMSLLSGQDMQPSEYYEIKKGIPYITGASNIDDSEIYVNRWTEYARAIARKGDLLLTCKGTVGKTAILGEDVAHIARQIMAITPLVVNIEYIKCFIESQIAYLKSQAKSMIPGIERNNVLFLLIPLPPLAEQKRIVARLKEILPLCEKLK